MMDKKINIFLDKNEGDFISRGQAKGIAVRFEKFLEIEINFSDIDFIGQGFADELFRVWKNKHPEIKLYAINTSNDVKNMISHVTKNNI
jgi:hypothetical protein